jgi:metallo-beta-lactamase family protein
MERENPAKSASICDRRSTSRNLSEKSNGIHMIKLGFFGAAGEVTGSCYVVTTDRARVMVDMGMHQGESLADMHNRRLPPFDLAKLDAVVLTHAHLDHCGRLPLLIKHGYHGKIHCTAPTVGMTGIVLRDSASLQDEDCRRFNRRLRRGQEPCQEPLYSIQDVEQLLPLMTPLEYGHARSIADGITIRLIDSGHILGAASVQMTVTDGSRTITIAFSGDVGMTGLPMLADPIAPTPADVVLLESTYGDRDHKSQSATVDELLSILKSAQSAKARVLIPAFAIGRTQDLVYYIGAFLRAGQLTGLKVFIDSPMALAISELYERYVAHPDDPSATSTIACQPPLCFPGLTYIHTVDESKALNTPSGAMVIIAASGMSTGGRIVHHLYHDLGNPTTQVIIAGYQGRGTLGRQLVDGAKNVLIFRDNVSVRASIHTLGGFSAHAGQSELVKWAMPFQNTKPRLFLTHGEDGPRTALKGQLKSRLGLECSMPKYGDIVDL